MKNTILGLLCAAAILATSSCVTTVSTNTLPDGTVVTVTSKTTDPAAVASAVSAAQALAPIIDKLIDKQTPPTPIALPAK